MDKKRETVTFLRTLGLTNSPKSGSNLVPGLWLSFGTESSLASVIGCSLLLGELALHLNTTAITLTIKITTSWCLTSPEP